MREILFRAKRIDNGEWVEGNFYESKLSGCYILHPRIRVRKKDGVIIGDRFDVYDIDPETLSQYTGLKDKNNNRIWENDIVGIENSMHEGIGSIEFYGGMWYVDGEPSNSLYDIVEYDDAEIEVIGNIFDNLELLKKVNQYRMEG